MEEVKFTLEECMEEVLAGVRGNIWLCKNIL